MPSIALPVSLRGQLLSGSRFSPLSLFATSEPGFWYDPSDLTTMFQDAVGTNPVTAPGQSVALLLDKSKRLTRGSELVVNGDFSGGTTNWTAISGAGLSIVSGSLRISYSAGAAYPAATQTVSGLVSGRTYELTIVANTGSGTHPVGLNCGQFSPTVNFTTNTSLTTTTFKAIASATSTSSYVQIFLVTNSASSSGFIDIVSFSMKELAGSHATQATAASCPTYGTHPLVGIRNVAQGSADVGNATYWPNTVLSNGVTSTKVASGIDTDGLPYIDVRYQGLSTGTFHASIYESAQSRSPAAVGQTFTASVYIQRIAGSSTNLGGLTLVLVEETAPTTFVNQSPSAGGISTTETLVTVSRTLTSGNQVRVLFVLNFDIGVTYDVTFRVKGLQLERSSSRTDYQFNYSRFNITQPSTAQVNYLSFDGVDDFLVTPTITPGANKVQVFAGVRKLSDAARGTIVEHSATIASNNGSFHLTAPNAASATFGFESKGTTLTDAVATFAAPTTIVVTGIGDIAGDSTIIRANGTQQDQDTADQGTGNYLAYPIYIGRRGGTTLPFNGQIYNMIVRFGTNLDAGAITSAETFVNGKTGAY